MEMLLEKKKTPSLIFSYFSYFTYFVLGIKPRAPSTCHRTTLPTLGRKLKSKVKNTILYLNPFIFNLDDYKKTTFLYTVAHTFNPSRGKLISMSSRLS